MKLKMLALLLMAATFTHGREWAAHEVSLRSQIEKIRTKEKAIAEIVHEKNKEKDDQKLKEYRTEIQKEYKELVKLYNELEEEKRHVRFEHPDQGVEVERKYQIYKIKSIEDMESDVGTDGRLSRLKAKVVRKYGQPTPVVDEAPEESISEEPKPPEKEEKRPKLSY